MLIKSYDGENGTRNLANEHYWIRRSMRLARVMNIMD